MGILPRTRFMVLVNIFFLLLFVATVGYFEVQDPNPFRPPQEASAAAVVARPECDYIKDPIEQLRCLGYDVDEPTKEAITICDLIEDQALRDQCYYELALGQRVIPAGGRPGGAIGGGSAASSASPGGGSSVEEEFNPQNPTDCDPIPYAEEKDECLTIVAKNQNNIEICDLIADSFWSSICRDQFQVNGS